MDNFSNNELRNLSMWMKIHKQHAHGMNHYIAAYIHLSSGH